MLRWLAVGMLVAIGISAIVLLRTSRSRPAGQDEYRAPVGAEAPAALAAPDEPRPGDIVGRVAGDLGMWPLGAVEAERRLTLAEVHDLERRVRILSATLEQRRASVRTRLRALYRLSQGGFAGLLLGADSLAEFYRRKNGARRILMRDLEEIVALRAELQELDGEQVALVDRIGRIAMLEHEAVRARRRAQTGADAELHGLARLMGRLPRPVAPGKILAPFGMEADGRGIEIFRHGIELSAEPGGTVYAVAPGQVRFTGEIAGLLRGVIIEHAGGYLTLYGRLDQVQVQTGELVQAGTPLALAPYPRVFFQLALGDLPLDPRPWFTPHGR